MRKLLLPAATLAAALALAGPAAADTYCVHQSGTCPAGTTDSGANLVAALAAAASSPIADTVTIGPGTFTAPANGFKLAGTSPLTVVGAGPSTILDGATTPIVDLNGASSPALSDVAVHVAAQSAYTGVAATGPASISRVLVTGTGATGRTGINAAGAVTVSDSEVALSGAADMGFYVSPFNGAAPTIRDTTISSWTAVYANGGGSPIPVTLQRILAVSHGLDVTANAATVNLDDSVIHHTSGSSPALVAQCPGVGGSAVLNADHVTVVSDGNGTAIESSCQTAGDAASVTVTNSSVRAFANLSFRSAANGATADIAATWSDVPTASNGDSGPGAVALGAGVVTVANPGFAGVGDEHLVAGSPLIDAGNPLPSPFTLDRDRLARVSGGRQDIGAYELQVAAPPAPANGTQEVPTAAGVPVDAAPDASPTAAPAPPRTPLSPPAQPTTAQLRGALRAAIATGTRGTHTLRWLTAGRVTFTWRRGGHVIAQGTATRTTPGRQRVAVRAPHGLPRHGAVAVRATFTPVVGRAVTVERRLAR